jgi:hypothetical protein
MAKAKKQEARRAHDLLKERKEKAEPAQRALFEEEVTESLEDLELSLVQQEARSGLVADINPRILVEYNTRKAQVIHKLIPD